MSEKYVPKPNPILAAQIIKGLEQNGNRWTSSLGLAEHIPTASPAQRWNVVSQMASDKYALLEKRPAVDGEPHVLHYRLTGRKLDAALTESNTRVEPTNKRKYVRWSNAEREMIREAVREYRKQRPVTMREAANTVQDILVKEGKLAADKKRRLSTTAEVSWLFSGSKTDVPPTPTPAAAPPVGAVETPTASVQAAEVLTQPPQPAKRQEPLSTSALVEQLLGKLQQGATKVLADAIDYGITRAFRNIMNSAEGQKLLAQIGAPVPASVGVKHDPRPPSADRERLTRILIAGKLKANEQGEIKKEFEDVFDLRFWTPDKTPHLLKALSRSVDNTIIMTDKIGHSDAELITRANIPYTLTNGGPNQLKDLLTTLYVTDGN